MNTTLRLICALLFITQQLNAQWTTLNSGITDAITSISVPSADSVYAVSTDFFNGGKIIASHNGSTFTTRLVDATFPDYKQIIPKEYTTTVTVSKEELQKAIVELKTTHPHQAKEKST